LAVFSENGVE